VGRFPIGGEGGWDYISIDSEARRLYAKCKHFFSTGEELGSDESFHDRTPRRRKGVACQSLERFQVFNDLHALLFRELGTDDTLSSRPIIEFMPGVRVAGHIGAELLGAL
jgi:hypothetical protein